ncbi:MAG: hypothetical protein IRY91_03770 [Gemmatimonadaceae bacterium]|nr:hypothetical protein [Gemmatimonadaceae bacterium]
MRWIKARHGRGRMAALAVLAVAALGAGRAVSDATAFADRTTYGRAVKIGHGTARTYLTMRGGMPEVGVALSEGALAGLPDEHAPGGVFAHGHTTFETVLELPAENRTRFRHVLLNWNPRGHEPPGIYDTPHFDFHFYVIDSAARVAIDPADPEYQRKAERKPAAEWIPARYVMPAPLAFARMGVHWVDTTSAELKGEPFTRTFIYGSWDGRVIFVEPMVTKAYLETQPEFSATLPAPPRGRGDGYYPEGYSVRWDAARKEYRIALTGLPPRR